MILTTNPRQSIKLYASGGVSYYAATAELGAQVEKWRRAFGNLTPESTAELIEGKPVTTELKTFFVRNPASVAVRVELSLVESAVSTVLARFDIPAGGRRDYESGRGWLNATSIAGGTTGGTTTIGTVTGKLPIEVEDGEAGPVVKIREATEDDSGTMSGPDKAKLNALTPVDLSAKADLVGGKLPTSQLPDLAISDFLGVVASQAAMLALTGERGDWCERSDPPGKVWILVDDDASLLASWRELVYPASTSHALGSHTDTTLAGTPDDKEIVSYQTSTGKWIGQRINSFVGLDSGTSITINFINGVGYFGISAATTSAAGSLSAADQTKLNAISASLPTSTAWECVLKGDGSGDWENSEIIATSDFSTVANLSSGTVGVVDVDFIYMEFVPGGLKGVSTSSSGNFTVGCATAPSTIQYKDHSGVNKTINLTNGIVTTVT
jgi:hypothetical protein